jgi:hypothetical protein
MKKCSNCGEEKELAEYNNEKAKKDGKQSECRDCRKSYDRQYRIEKPEKVRPDRKDKILLRLYGITYQQKLDMVAAQNNRCAICNNEFINSKDICVDHRHSDMKVRELLCKKCNYAIGLFDEDKERMSRAIEYLDKHE